MYQNTDFTEEQFQTLLATHDGVTLKKTKTKDINQLWKISNRCSYNKMRPYLNNMLLKNGYSFITNGSWALKLQSNYSEQMEGELITIDGKVSEDKTFPKIEATISNYLKSSHQIDIDIDFASLRDFLANFRFTKKQSPEVILKFSQEQYIVFPFEALALAVHGALHLGENIRILYSDSEILVIEGEKGAILLCSVQDRLPYDEIVLRIGGEQQEYLFYDLTSPCPYKYGTRNKKKTEDNSLVTFD